MKTIRVNGAVRQLAASSNVTEMVVELELAAAALLIEHNGTALLRGEWNDTAITDGDRIEILRIAAGG